MNLREAALEQAESEATRLREICADIRRQLKGHPDSRLDGENGLAAATMRRIEQLEQCCRIALWIRDKLKERRAWGSHFEEWKDIEAALDLAAPAETASSLQGSGDEPSQSVTK